MVYSDYNILSKLWYIYINTVITQTFSLEALNSTYIFVCVNYFIVFGFPSNNKNVLDNHIKTIFSFKISYTCQNYKINKKRTGAI